MESNPALEAAIEQNPDDTASYSVLADWLQSRGDPRGELIATQLAGDEAAFGGLLVKHGEAFVGPLAPLQRASDGEEAFTWKHGFISSVRLSYNNYGDGDEVDLAEGLRALLAHPSGRFVRELVFGFNGDPNEDNLQSLIDVIAEAERPTLRSLVFGDFKYAGAARDQDQGDDTEISWYSVGNLSQLWPKVPNLEKLVIQTGSAGSAQGGGCTVGALQLPKLRHFEYRTGGLDAQAGDAVAAIAAPKLEHLDLWFGQDNYGDYGSEGGLACANQLLARTDLEALRHLGIMNCEAVDQLVPAIAMFTKLHGLAELDLSLGCLSDEGAAALAEHADELASLGTIDVSYNNLSEAGLAALAGVAKTVVSVKQRAGDDHYSAVGE